MFGILAGILAVCVQEKIFKFVSSILGAFSVVSGVSILLVCGLGLFALNVWNELLKLDVHFMCCSFFVRIQHYWPDTASIFEPQAKGIAQQSWKVSYVCQYVLMSMAMVSMLVGLPSRR